MALPIRPNSGAQPASKPAAVRRPSPKTQPAGDFSLPSLDDLMDETPTPRKSPIKRPAPSERKLEPEIQKVPELEEGWAVDEKTGMKYKTIPKSVYKGKGKNAIPLLAIEDFDADNMTGEAETYLSHLRVPPDKEEQERLKQLRAQLRKRSDASYAEANKDEIEEPNELIEEVAKEQPKQSFIQKITSLFR